MKFLKPILSIFAIAVIASCGNANSSSSSAPAPTDSTVTTEQETEEEEVSGIRVPDIKLDSLGKIHEDNSYNLFSRYDNQIALSPNGIPVIAPYNAYGLENTKGIKKVKVLSLFFHVVKKGDKYYDWETDSVKIALKDTRVYECEAIPYIEFYEYDSQGRIIKYGYGDAFENLFYSFVKFQYGAAGKFKYKYEIIDDDSVSPYSPIIINGTWDGKEWTEEIQKWNDDNKKLNDPIRYILRPISGHSDFFTTNTVEGNHPIDLRYRFQDGVLGGAKLGGIISDETLKNHDDAKIIKEDKDSHGNYRNVTVISSDYCNQEIQYEITYR